MYFMIMKKKYYRVELRKDLESELVDTCFVLCEVAPDMIPSFIDDGYQVSIICDVYISFELSSVDVALSGTDACHSYPDIIKITHVFK